MQTYGARRHPRLRRREPPRNAAGSSNPCPLASVKRRRARLTRRQLWKEYRDEAVAQGGTAYSYSQFYARLKARLKGGAGQTEMRFKYAPGLWGLSDFSSKTLGLRIGLARRQAEPGPPFHPEQRLVRIDPGPRGLAGGNVENAPGDRALGPVEAAEEYAARVFQTQTIARSSGHTTPTATRSCESSSL